MRFITNSNWLIPSAYCSCTRGPFIFVRPEYVDDLALLAHEQVHVKQWFRTLGIHPILYALWPKYRLDCEVEAYVVQIQHRAPQEDLDMLVSRYSRFIAEKYNLNISVESVEQMLYNKLK